MLPEKFDMAVRLLDWGDAASALTILEDCAREIPQNALVQFVLGEACVRLGRTQEACAAYRSYLELDATDCLGAGARLHVIGGAPMPQELPAAYVRRLFDDYAEGFEKMLLGPLAYKAPQFVDDALKKAGAGPFRRVLDLGCGTGLSAEAFKNSGAAIDGVDISPRMLEKAYAKNIYANLREAEISTWLNNCTQSYDLVLCTDVLVYFGALEDLFQKIAKVLATGGVFAFTVQASKDADYAMGTDQKFVHARDYVESCAKIADFKVQVADACTLRLDHGEPVAGTVFVCRK